MRKEISGRIYSICLFESPVSRHSECECSVYSLGEAPLVNCESPTPSSDLVALMSVNTDRKSARKSVRGSVNVIDSGMVADAETPSGSQRYRYRAVGKWTCKHI